MPLIDKSYCKDTLFIKWSIEPEHDNLRLDQFLGLYFKSQSREDIKKKIYRNECNIINRQNSKKPSTKIKTNDIISIKMTRGNHEDEYWKGIKVKFQDPSEIFEDGNMIVCNKPPYMSTHPTGRHLFHCGTTYYEQKNNIKTAHSIHRLDRETSGILLIAKNPKTAKKLTVEFEKNNVKKCYFFIAKKASRKINRSFKAKQRMDNPEKGLKKVIVKHYPEGDQQGKHAETDFEILHDNENYCFGLAFPKTGRTHQIRVHAKANNIPLVGDKLYLGGYEMFQRFKDAKASNDDHNKMLLSRHALHAIGLQIKYEGEKKLFIADIPKDMREFIDSFFHIEVNKTEKLIRDKINTYLN